MDTQRWVSLGALCVAAMLAPLGAGVVAQERPQERCGCPTFAGPSGDTQLALNRSAAAGAAAMEQRLDAVAGLIGALNEDDRALTHNLGASQRAWRGYRDAQLALYWPDPRDWGSVYPMVYLLKKRELTHQRVHALLPWLEGVEEGDVGSGTVPTSSDVRARLAALREAEGGR